MIILIGFHLYFHTIIIYYLTLIRYSVNHSVRLYLRFCSTLNTGINLMKHFIFFHDEAGSSSSLGIISFFFFCHSKSIHAKEKEETEFKSWGSCVLASCRRNKKPLTQSMCASLIRFMPRSDPECKSLCTPTLTEEKYWAAQLHCIPSVWSVCELWPEG